jgi:two-component system osmolarity sensor histidine kinase EnvZ
VPKGISSRFLAILIVPVVLSQIVFGIIFFGKYVESVMRIMTQHISSNVALVCKILELGHSADHIRNLEIEVEVLHHARLKKEDSAKNKKFYRLLRNSLNKKGLSNHYIKPFKNKVIIFVESGSHDEIYKISFPYKYIYTRIVPVTFWWSIASAIVLLIIAFIFLKNQIRPIKKLAIAIERFGNGDSVGSFVPEGATEIKQACIAFCEMKSSLLDLMNKRMTMLAGVSHDLRTPLTKIKLQLSMMQRSREVELLLNDVDTMTKITESFTIHASQQNKEMFVHRNLNAILNEVANLHSSNKFSIHITGEKSIDVCVKYISLRRAFENITSNAAKYSKNLYIDFELCDGEALINFEDDGPGIDQEFYDVIFEPFFSQNHARTHNNGSDVGLGLSIARDAIVGLGGRIEAGRSKIHGGARFTITLPATGTHRAI